jgi:NAD(P)-dependent dehydrogenase (short-subunit alcohol dehydrogenase family)
MRVVVVGASSGLGRCIGVGLSQSGADVALLGRRVDRLKDAVGEGGGTGHAIACDVTEPTGCAEAIAEAATALGGIDGLVYTPAIGPLGPIEELSAQGWANVFATNVTGAALVTAAALPHLKESAGSALYLSSVSGSQTPPWPGLGAYAVSKAALDKLVEAWRAEHPSVGFTRVVVGDCAGGEGDSITGFASEWDSEMSTRYVTTWLTKGYIAGNLLPVERLVSVVDLILQSGAADSVPSIVVAPRPLL